jgi:hypothetical protein
MQPKKVYCEIIGMGAKSITIVRAVTTDFFFDCRAAEVPSDSAAIAGKRQKTRLYCMDDGIQTERQNYRI